MSSAPVSPAVGAAPSTRLAIDRAIPRASSYRSRGSGGGNDGGSVLAEDNNTYSDSSRNNNNHNNNNMATASSFSSTSGNVFVNEGRGGRYGDGDGNGNGRGGVRSGTESAAGGDSDSHDNSSSSNSKSHSQSRSMDRAVDAEENLEPEGGGNAERFGVAAAQLFNGGGDRGCGRSNFLDQLEKAASPSGELRGGGHEQERIRNDLQLPSLLGVASSDAAVTVGVAAAAEGRGVEGAGGQDSNGGSSGSSKLWHRALQKLKIKKKRCELREYPEK